MSADSMQAVQTALYFLLSSSKDNVFGKSSDLAQSATQCRAGAKRDFSEGREGGRGREREREREREGERHWEQSTFRQFFSCERHYCFDRSVADDTPFFRGNDISQEVWDCRL